MAEWVVVYCNKSVADLRDADLLRELRSADLLMLAEAAGLEDEVAERAAEQLRFERTVTNSGFLSTELHYGAQLRPIQIRRDSAPLEATQEVIDTLPDIIHPGLASIRRHLHSTVECVSFELSAEAAQGMADILVEVLAFFVAQRGAGIVNFYGNAWFSPENRRRSIWQPA